MTVKEKLYIIPHKNMIAAIKEGVKIDAFSINSFQTIETIDLDYKPVVFRKGEEADTEGYHVENDGFGGSDAGAIFGYNKNRTPGVAVRQKLGLIARTTPDADLQFMFDYGHVMEQPLLTYYANKYEREVWTDRSQYQHPFYPWMKADMDGFCRLPNGEIAILECKTYNPDAKKHWESGTYGVDGKLGNKEYLIQAVHDMAVCNLNTTIFIAASKNTASDIKVVTVHRDLDLEKEVINCEGMTWANMMNGICPTDDIMSDMSYKTLMSGITVPQTNVQATYATLPDSELQTIDDIEQLKNQIKQLDDEKKTLNAQLNAKKADLIFKLGSDYKAECGDYRIYVNESQGRKTFNQTKLKADLPDIYNAYVKVGAPNKTLTIRKINNGS